MCPYPLTTTVTVPGIERSTDPQFGGWYVEGQATVFHGLSTDIPLSLPNAIYRTVCRV